MFKRAIKAYLYGMAGSGVLSPIFNGFVITLVGFFVIPGMVIVAIQLFGTTIPEMASFLSINSGDLIVKTFFWFVVISGATLTLVTTIICEYYIVRYRDVCSNDCISEAGDLFLIRVDPNTGAVSEVGKYHVWGRTRDVRCFALSMSGPKEMPVIHGTYDLASEEGPQITEIKVIFRIHLSSPINWKEIVDFVDSEKYCGMNQWIEMVCDNGLSHSKPCAVLLQGDSSALEGFGNLVKEVSDYIRDDNPLGLYVGFVNTEISYILNGTIYR